jgi:hypothetical protein
LDYGQQHGGGPVVKASSNVAIATPSYVLQFSIEDMRRFGGEAWGQLGVNIVDKWCEFNAAYFDNALRPVPLVITNTLPFGKRLAFCSYNPDASGRTITLNVPRDHKVLVADNNTLLHEMVHQFLFERGEYASHDGAPWRREITRLTKHITGKEIWAGPSKVVRQNGKAIRINASHPETGQPSLSQKVIARWPHDEVGIDFGRLGCNSKLRVARR